jgi:hypothetical protein
MDTAENNAANIADIELALAGLEIPDIIEGGEIEETVEASAEPEVIEVDEDAIQAAVSAIEAEEAKQEIYEGAEEGPSLQEGRLPCPGRDRGG